MRDKLLARVVWLARVVPDSHSAKDIYSSWHFEQRFFRRLMKSELVVCQFAEVLYTGEQMGLLSVPIHFHSPVTQWSLCWGDLPSILVLSHLVWMIRFMVSGGLQNACLHVLLVLWFLLARSASEIRLQEHRGTDGAFKVVWSFTIISVT